MISVILKKIDFSSKCKTIMNICLKERSKIQVNPKHGCEVCKNLCANFAKDLVKNYNTLQIY